MKKVLMLEDEEVLARIYSKHIKAGGFQIEVSGNVDDAEKKLKSYAPDIFLIDHAIKGEKKTGIDLIPELRAKFPKSSIVVLSNYSQFQYKEAALKAGADDYWVKIDIEPDDLVERLKQMKKKKA